MNFGPNGLTRTAEQRFPAGPTVQLSLMVGVDLAASP